MPDEQDPDFGRKSSALQSVRPARSQAWIEEGQGVTQCAAKEKAPERGLWRWARYVS